MIAWMKLEVGGHAVAVKGLLGLAGGNDIEDDDCDKEGCWTYSGKINNYIV